MGKWISQITPIQIAGILLVGVVLTVPPIFIPYPASLDIVSFFLGGLALVVAYGGIVLYAFDSVIERIHRYDEKLDETIVEEDAHVPTSDDML